jgi:hypothetical protein
MKIALEDANKRLRPIIRSIDKRADFVSSLTEGDKPGITLTLSKREKSKTIAIPLEAVVSAADDPVQRHRLRGRIKRAYDRMLFVAPPMASTKMERGSTSADGYFRPSGGGNRR